MSDGDDGLRTEDHEGVRHLVLCRARRHNVLDVALSARLADAVDAAECDAQVGALLVRAEGEAFCVGADPDELRRADHEALRAIDRGCLRVARAELPTVAVVQGPAVGAGLNLALACDVRLAAPQARFASRFVDLGLHPGGGHAWLLERLLGVQGAAALTLLGEELDGPDAVQRGLAWRCLAADQLVDEAQRLAARVAAVPEPLRGEVLRTVRHARAAGGHEEAVERELARQWRSLRDPRTAERLGAAPGPGPGVWPGGGD